MVSPLGETYEFCRSGGFHCHEWQSSCINVFLACRCSECSTVPFTQEKTYKHVLLHWQCSLMFFSISRVCYRGLCPDMCVRHVWALLFSCVVGPIIVAVCSLIFGMCECFPFHCLSLCVMPKTNDALVICTLSYKEVILCHRHTTQAVEQIVQSKCIQNCTPLVFHFPCQNFTAQRNSTNHSGRHTSSYRHWHFHARRG